MGDADRYTGAWRAFCLVRLGRFSRLALAPPVAAPELRRLARRAVLSAYRDCAAAGVEAEARGVMAAAAEEMRARSSGSAPP